MTTVAPISFNTSWRNYYYKSGQLLQNEANFNTNGATATTKQGSYYKMRQTLVQMGQLSLQIRTAITK